MARTGDKAKQPPECKINNAPPSCPHIQTIRETWESETLECKVCGEYTRSTMTR